MKHVAEPALTYDQSTWEPKARPEELKSWWVRKLPERSIYSPYIVKVLDRKQRDGRLTLKFEILLEQGKASPPYTVTLPVEQGVWPDLPSTAQLVDPELKTPYGFLFLSDQWAKEHQVVADAVATPGEMSPKFPPAGLGTEDDVDTQRVLQAMKNPVMRAKLLEVLDRLSGEASGGQESR